MLKQVDLQLGSGQILALLGRSGCGKSTLLRMIAGFDRPDQGQISLMGQLLVNDNFFLVPERRNVGFVFQDLALFPHLNVSENIGFGLRDRSSRQQKVEEMLELFQLQSLAGQPVSTLSGGQAQRVAIARSLAINPNLLLLDESFNSLDRELRYEIRQEVREVLKKRGTTAIFVTHDVEDAFQMADELAVMNNGVIVQRGTPAEVYRNPINGLVASLTGSINQLHDGEQVRFIRPESLVLKSGGDWKITNKVFMHGYYVYTVNRGEQEMHCRSSLEFSAGEWVQMEW